LPIPWYWFLEAPKKVYFFLDHSHSEKSVEMEDRSHLLVIRLEPVVILLLYHTLIVKQSVEYVWHQMGDTGYSQRRVLSWEFKRKRSRE